MILRFWHKWTVIAYICFAMLRFISCCVGKMLAHCTNFKGGWKLFIWKKNSLTHNLLPSQLWRIHLIIGFFFLYCGDGGGDGAQIFWSDQQNCGIEENAIPSGSTAFHVVEWACFVTYFPDTKENGKMETLKKTIDNVCNRLCWKLLQVPSCFSEMGKEQTLAEGRENISWFLWWEKMHWNEWPCPASSAVLHGLTLEITLQNDTFYVTSVPALAQEKVETDWMLTQASESVFATIVRPDKREISWSFPWSGTASWLSVSAEVTYLYYCYISKLYLTF